ncbi:hypothetical protein IGS68_35100 (plasmid) [Skermanella sp. TT6]|uniref:Uncharacterized protein n=1 Tax=Skermanella cutis TaxID=2775420 RepID=A0ABX7BIW2_9PROT|nr:hypothetical protein [Skermanella sp. TT6]QQP94040.1 hypothetical protein IGS68_35100 [Skermanella sp. TT6]
MTDEFGPIPPGHIRISLRMGDEYFTSQFEVKDIEKRLAALEHEFRKNARLAKNRRTNDGYAAARTIAYEAAKTRNTGVVCTALLWMFLYRTNPSQSKASHDGLKKSVKDYGAAWIVSKADAEFENWSFTLQYPGLPIGQSPN